MAGAALLLVGSASLAVAGPFPDKALESAVRAALPFRWGARRVQAMERGSASTAVEA